MPLARLHDVTNIVFRRVYSKRDEMLVCTQITAERFRIARLERDIGETLYAETTCP